MKQLKTFLFTIIALTLIQSHSAMASHGMGGELTWRCLGNGQYVFTLKFYRDCNGIPAPSNLAISTTVPGLATIPTTVISQTDISPDGFLENGLSTCPTCLTGGSGTVQETIYQTDSITLNGVPPAQGWEFYWGECCRSSNLTNILNPGSVGFRLNAKMFSYNGQNANPCFDSSPYFAERPSFIVCSNLPIVYNHLSADAEFDSINYEFINPLDDLGGQTVFANGYSASTPLSGTNVLNSQTGEFFSTGSTGGYYAMAIKASSYKCGTKVAEIMREVNIVIMNNCPTIMNGVINTPPEVNAPFADPISGLFTSYADTVIVGDTANFQLTVTDLELFNNSTFQIITFDAYGLQYGDSFTNTSSGCLIPPCATLSPPPPFVGAAALALQFNWQTSTAHLGYSLSCVQFSNTYYFINRAQDNYCPANGIDTRVFSITVVSALLPPPVDNNGGTLECTWGPGFTYQWFLNRFAIPGANTSSYTPVQPGIYQVLAIAQNGDGNYSEGYNYNPLGIYENTMLSNVSIHPNPGKDGIFHVNFNMDKTGPLNFTITDMVGRLVVEKEIVAVKGTNNFDIDLSNSTNGIYTFGLRVGKAGSNYYKLLKTE